MLRLRELREEIGKTQQEMAQIFQISRQVYANYENEINEPSLDMLVKFANFFDCTIDFLLFREDNGFGVISIQEEKDALSEEEKALIRDYRALAPALQEMLRSTIQTWKGSPANSSNNYGAERRHR